MSLFLNEYDWPTLAMPQFDFSGLESEWRRFVSSIPEPWKFNNDGREFTIGDALKERGLSAEYPVVLVPGVISTVCQ